MMIGRCAETEFAKHGIPWQDVFGMNQCEPRGVGGPKRHVRPNVTRAHNLCRAGQRKDNHANRIRQTAVKGIKQSWIGKAMMRFVRILIKRWSKTCMFQIMHDELYKFLTNQTGGDFVILNRTVE